MFNKSAKLLQLFAILLVVPICSGVCAEISPESVKSSYVVQMQKFVKLGNPPRDVKNICYYEKRVKSSNESVGQQIEKYVKSNPNGKIVSVKRFDAIGNFSGCDIFYISAEDEEDIKNILVALDSYESLTISGAPRFIFRGGMIGLIGDEENHIRMEGNLKNIKRKNIQVDSQLLELMVNVISQ